MLVAAHLVPGTKKKVPNIAWLKYLPVKTVDRRSSLIDNGGGIEFLELRVFAELRFRKRVDLRLQQ